MLASCAKKYSLNIDVCCHILTLIQNSFIIRRGWVIVTLNYYMNARTDNCPIIINPCIKIKVIKVLFCLQLKLNYAGTSFQIRVEEVVFASFIRKNGVPCMNAFTATTLFTSNYSLNLKKYFIGCWKTHSCVFIKLRKTARCPAIQIHCHHLYYRDWLVWSATELLEM